MMKNIFVLCAFVLFANGCNLLVEMTSHLEQLERHHNRLSFNITQLSLPRPSMYQVACRCMGKFFQELQRMVSSVTCKPAVQESICKTVREIRSKLLRNIRQQKDSENSTKAACVFRNITSSFIQNSKTSIINSYLKFVRQGNEMCGTCKHTSSAHTQ